MDRGNGKQSSNENAPPLASDARVRIFAKTAQSNPANGHDTPFDMDALDGMPDMDGGPRELIRTMIGMRRMELDMAQIARDPSVLRDYEQLPPFVQDLARTDPPRFWMLWQLGQNGIDLHEILAVRQKMDQLVEDGLRAAGWDGTSPLSDEQLQRAELATLQLLDQYADDER